MCIRAIYNICLNNPYAPAGDLRTVPAVSDVTAVGGFWQKQEFWSEKGNIANRMLIETLKNIQDWLLLSAFRNTDQNTELYVFDWDQNICSFAVWSEKRTQILIRKPV